MGLTVNTNLFSLNAQRNVGKVQNSLGTAIERLPIFNAFIYRFYIRIFWLR